MKRSLIISVIMLFFISLPVMAAEEEKEDSTPPMAFIFNISTLTNPLEGYQGGIGIKWLHESFTMRYYLDIAHSQRTDSSRYALGAALEKHMGQSFLSPYFGFTLSGAFEVEEQNISASVTERFTAIPLEAGGIFGIEVFVTPFLSLFAEYTAVLAYRLTSLERTVGSDTTTTDNNYFELRTGIGNNARIGITVYLEDRVQMPKRD